jgi:hypothetical protein
MRISSTAACVFFLWAVAGSAADEPPRTGSKAKLGGPAVDAILREACEIALKQDGDQRFWTERVLLQIGELQIHAGDYNGALKPIRASTYGRDAGLEHLAEALARRGKKERAFEILRMQDHGWPENGVQLKWVEYLIASSELGRAAKAIQELKYERQRPEGLRMLAVAYAKAKDSARAKEYFKLSIDTASGLKDDSDRARALWETADAQLVVGEADAAKATIRLLVEKTELKDPWAKCLSFTECAVLTAKMKDDETAHRLFRRAIEARDSVDSMNKMNALMFIAKAQAGVGYIDDALKTASMIPQGESYRGQAVYAIAVAQLKANDAERLTHQGRRKAWSFSSSLLLGTASRPVGLDALAAGQLVGGGTDLVQEGGGSSVFVGGSGVETLIGGKRRNLSIGGLGTATLEGRGAGDLLVGGATAYDNDEPALLAILKRWSRGDNYAERVAAIQGTGEHDDLGPYFLNLGTVYDSGAHDTLTGNGGRDLFFAGLNDIITDLQKDEIRI